MMSVTKSETIKKSSKINKSKTFGALASHGVLSKLFEKLKAFLNRLFFTWAFNTNYERI